MIRPLRPRVLGAGVLRRGSAGLSAVASLLLSVSLMGCTSAPAPVEIDRGVVFVEPTPEVKEANRRAAEKVAVRWLVRRVLVRMDQPLGGVWHLADETVLPEISRAVWNGNGLRVGVLDASVYGDFGQALGPTVEVQDLQIISQDHAEVLRRSPPLAAEFMADLTVPPGAVRQEVFTGGRLQLLLSAAALGNGTAEVTLTPQHYRARASLMPRPAYEKRLDGRVFDELAVSMNLPRDQTLLVGLFQPWHQPPEPTASPADRQSDTAGQGVVDANATDANTTDATAPDPRATQGPAEWKQPTGPLNLGRGLLTTGLKRQDLQVMYLLRTLPTGG